MVSMSRGQYLNDYSTLIDASFSNNTFKGTIPAARTAAAKTI